jgi:hypothetical protein
MKEAKKYLLDTGFDDAHLPLLFNDDDKSYYTIMELMHAYADHKLKLLGVADVIVPFVCRDCEKPTEESRDNLCEPCHKWHTDS